MRRWSDDWLRAQFHPNEILLPEEYQAGKEERFLQLCAETLAGYCPHRAPFVAEIFGARRVAESIWKFDRLTGDGRVQKMAVQHVNRNLARSEHFAEAEFRARLTRNLAEDIADVTAFLELARPRLDTEEELEAVPADNVSRLA